MPRQPRPPRLRTARPLNPAGPDHEVLPQLPLVEKAVPPEVRANFPPGTPTRCYLLGECSVIVTYSIDRWQISIAHPRRDPTWNELAQARYRCLPQVPWMAMYLPPKANYVNIHRFCYQILECEPLPEHF